MRGIAVYTVIAIFLKSGLGSLLGPGYVVKIEFNEYEGQGQGVITHFYKIKKCLQSGKFGAVYSASLVTKDYLFKIAYWADSGRTFALKVSEIKGRYDRYRNEYLATRKIHKTGKIDGFSYTYGTGPITGVTATYDGIAVVLDFIDGKEFLEYAGKPGSRKTTLEFFAQILPILHVLQENEIVHRDLKPENILVLNKKSIQFVLIDFDVALFEGSLVHFPIVGTFLHGCINLILKRSGIKFDSGHDVYISRYADDLQTAVVTFYFTTTEGGPWENKRQDWGHKLSLIYGFLRDLAKAYTNGSKLYNLLSDLFLKANDDGVRRKPFPYVDYLATVQDILLNERYV